ncbi:MAG: HDOD domain-containing protein [Deltaproteobacteria bacterium]
MSRLDEILLLVKAVPSFPKVAHRVLSMLDDPSVKAAQLAEVIKYDPAITANILKICNAAIFGLPRKVSSLEEALVLIGTNELKDIVITSSTAKFFKGRVGMGYELEQGDLWRHSVAAAIVAKYLSPFVKGTNVNVAFTTALLHDIGKRFLSSFVADDFARIIQKVDAQHLSFVEAEKEVMGTNHAELGGMVLENWEFDKEMVAAVREHHEPDALEKGPLSALIALSNAVVVSIGIGGGADGLAIKIQGDGLKKFGITTQIIESCMTHLLFEMEKAEEVLSI